MAEFAELNFILFEHVILYDVYCIIQRNFSNCCCFRFKLTAVKRKLTDQLRGDKMEKSPRLLAGSLGRSQLKRDVTLVAINSAYRL